MERGTLFVVIFVSCLVGLLLCFCCYKTVGLSVLDRCCGSWTCDWCCDFSWCTFCSPRRETRRRERPTPYPSSPANLPIIILQNPPRSGDSSSSSSDDDDDDGGGVMRSTNPTRKQLTVTTRKGSENVPVVV